MPAWAGAAEGTPPHVTVVLVQSESPMNIQGEVACAVTRRCGLYDLNVQKLPSGYLTDPDPTSEHLAAHVCLEMKGLGQKWFDRTYREMKALLPIEQEGSMCPTVTTLQLNDSDDPSPDSRTPCRDSDFDRVFRSYSSALWSEVCMYKLLLRQLGNSTCEKEIKIQYENSYVSQHLERVPWQ